MYTYTNVYIYICIYIQLIAHNGSVQHLDLPADLKELLLCVYIYIYI